MKLYTKGGDKGQTSLIGGQRVAKNDMSEGYVMPEDFTPCIVIYEYEDVCVCVSFTQIGEGVVSAAAQFAAPEITELLSLPFEE